LKRELVDVMQGKGFVLERCWTNDPLTNEEKCVFAQSERRLNTRDDCFKDFFPGEEWVNFLTSTYGSDEIPPTLAGNAPNFLPDETYLHTIMENLCCTAKYLDMIADTDSRTALETQLPDLECFDLEFTAELCCPDNYLLRSGLVDSAAIETFFRNLTSKLDLRRPFLYFGW
jgi:hypothetical protein